MARKLSYAYDFDDFGRDWIAQQMSYSEDFETHKSLCHKQSVLFHVPRAAYTTTWKSIFKKDNIINSGHQLRLWEENLNVTVMLEMHIFPVIDILEVNLPIYLLFRFAILVGRESRLKLILDSRGFGFVRFHDKRDASDAIKGNLSSNISSGYSDYRHGRLWNGRTWT